MSLLTLFGSGSGSIPIYKMQPNRTMHLRGFDRRGAAGALHHTSSTGLQVTGVFRDAADFCVLMLYDADDFFAHPAVKYLPSFDFTGQTLQFDVIFTNLQPLDSPKFASIDWPYLDVVRQDGTTAQVKLWDYAVKQAGTYGVASNTYTLNGTPVAFDRVQLWYENVLFDFPFSSPTPETPTVACANLAAQVNATNWNSVTPDIALRATASTNTITVTAARYGTVNTSGTAVTWVSGNKFVGASGTIQINGVVYTISSVTDATHLVLTATAGTQSGVAYLADRGGVDGNRITMYELHKTGTAFFTPAGSAQFTGGDSATTWRVTLPFNTLLDKDGVTSVGTSIRQMWFTYAPLIANGAAYVHQEWSAVYSNWSVTDASSTRVLKVAGAGSERVGSRDEWVTSTGTWTEEAGFFEEGFANRTSTSGDKVTITYHCQHTHDLYLGTSLYKDRGIVSVTVDGVAQADVDMYLNNEPAVVTRRLLKAATTAGAHTVILTLKATKNASSTGFNFYFDFLEATVAADVSDPVYTYSDRSAASDWDTDHGYKLSPQRLVWLQDRVGLRGDWNHYAGVFWWNQRKRLGGSFHVATVTFAGAFTAGGGFGGATADAIFITIGGQTIGKTVYPADTLSTIAAHFVAFINETFVGVWASSASGVLTITSSSPIYDFSFSTSFTPATGSTGTVTAAGDLHAGNEGTWIIDDTVTPVLNKPATDWHGDFCTEIAAHSLNLVVAFSQELLNPPEGANVWIQRYFSGNTVLTATGFGTEGAGVVEATTGGGNPTITMTGHGYATGNQINIGFGSWLITRVDNDHFTLTTTIAAYTPIVGDTVNRSLQTAQCAFSATVQAYMKQAYKEMAALEVAASLTPWLQFGEILHWFFSDWSGVVTGASNASPISITCTAHGRVTGENVIVAGVKGNTAANGTWPIIVTDANHFTLTGSHGLAGYVAATGRAVGGSMALYDADQTAAATASLGRSLARFYTQDDDPAINSHADAIFLYGRVKAHIDAIRTYVLASYAGAKFELLFPLDVCWYQAYSSADLPYPQGGRLNRYINLPAAYNTKAGSGLDRIKMEALSWGSFYRNISNAEETVKFPYTVLSWAKADTRYLLPIFNGGCPWTLEHIFCVSEGTPNVTFWANDQFCLLGWPLLLPVPQATSRSV